MSLVVAFGTRIGAIGQRVRVPMAARVASANDTLAERTNGGTRIVQWFGHTGNFVIHVRPEATGSLQADLQTALGVPCCLVTVQQLQDYVAWLDDLGAPAPSRTARWTPGLAFLIEGTPSTVDNARAEGALFERLAHDVVGIWKRQTVDARGSRKRFSGGWVVVSSVLQQQLGGIWTVRSIRSVLGILKRAVEHDRGLPSTNE